MGRIEIARTQKIRLVASVILAVSVANGLEAREDPIAPGMPDPAKIGREEPEAEASGPIDHLFDTINPARLQRGFDRFVGFDGESRPPKPEAPEIGEPVFFDLTRPLGDSRSGNELNYLLNPSTRNAPTLQVIEYEYTFAEWRSAELDLSYFNGALEILTPFYQRTLGVGRRRNWVHGYQVSPDIYLRSGFVGGSAVYVLGWKPEKESKFSSLFFLGANRTLIGGFRPGPFSGLAASAVQAGDKTYGSWRPTVNLDLVYQLTKKWAVGIEDDFFFQSGRASEYFVFPFLTYKPGEHAFFQIGGGYYHFESRDQFTFLLHLNFVNSAPKKPKVEEAEEPAETSAAEPGPIARWLARHADRR